MALTRPSVALAFFSCLISVPGVAQQPLRTQYPQAPGMMPPQGPPLPAGQEVDVHDGDLVVFGANARLRMVRRTSATVRVLYNPETRSVVLLAGRAADGLVDETYTFRDVDGAWPLPPRWEGAADIYEYVAVDRNSTPAGIGVRTAVGLTQVLTPTRQDVFRDPGALATLIYHGGEHAVGGRDTFDEAERKALDSEARAAAMDTHREGGTATAAGSRVQPVRVGGAITPPIKLLDVRPVYPDAAMKARVSGTVVIEATIAPDGSVQEAKVLKSVRELDEAALNAVRQWRFTPTQINGVAVPVIMTVTVSFSLQ